MTAWRQISHTPFYHCRRLGPEMDPGLAPTHLPPRQAGLLCCSQTNAWAGT